MGACEDNPFCSHLPDDVRARLCSACVKVPYVAGAIDRHPYQQAMLVAEGLVITRNSGKSGAALIPGSFSLTPKLGPTPRDPAGLSETELGLNGSDFEWRCYGPTSIAYFPDSLINELLDTQPFCRMVLDSHLRIQLASSTMEMSLYHGTAYEAVRYVMRLLKANRITGLTHEQIAEISGRSRVTVTRTIHEIALAEPELIVEEPAASS